jgi:hypothetical protein
MSFFTMLMTIPEILTIWFGHQVAGVSLLSWSACLVSPFCGFGLGYKQEHLSGAWAGWC